MRRRRVLPAALMAGVMWLAGCTDQPILEPGEQEVPAPSLSVQEADLIPGQYIVVFNDDVKEPVQLALQLAAAHGLTMRHTYQHTIKGFSAVVPEGRLRALEQHPMVQYVEQNSYMYIDTHERFLEIAAENQAAAAALALGLLSSPAAGAAPFRAPTNLSATAVSETQINVTWTDRNGDEAGHEVHRSNSPTGTFTKVADLGPNSTSYDDTGLASSTQYC
ncbi:MAG: hypothetical protein GTN62_00125, partial [Gemmatimonadales bacterium]|nr:hypothetical protein [Gemmatimonadales bacterium]NIN48514.1 hypothetical protein [Gemmatimonadales bacterium]NIP05978.1 hypothetical protein [Gemmatimonadales bacterium]NIQ99930.1 hypothetical protein [Gemmatimonadales bacterium]NIS64389.1 hypothetical protein [Gemmatimonadales bacterium]